MKTIKLQVKKKECEDTCPIPISLISNVEEGIQEIDYNKKTEIAITIYNEKILSEKQIINKLNKMEYGIKK